MAYELYDRPRIPDRGEVVLLGQRFAPPSLAHVASDRRAPFNENAELDR